MPPELPWSFPTRPRGCSSIAKLAMKKLETPLIGQVGRRPPVGRHLGIRGDLGEAVSHSFIPVLLVGLAETVECLGKPLYLRAGGRVVFRTVVALKLAVDCLQLVHIREEALVVDNAGLEVVGAGSGQQG
ncbi:MAG: hypothetical protein O7G28_12825, partial [Deltaproteobacteria bacterium]|nr:hypothetical protein [Deltaproteobacteria bacterium]